MDTPPPQLEPAPLPTITNWRRLAVIIAVLLALAGAMLVAIHFIFLPKGLVADHSDTQSESTGVPLVVASTTPPVSEYQYDDSYIPWEVAVPESRIAKIRSIIGTSTPRVANDTYHLFLDTSGGANSFGDGGTWSASDYVTYIDDGVIKTGKYASYHLVLASYPSDGPGPPIYFTFATKDYVSFVANGNPGDVPNPGFVNTAKISGVDQLPIRFENSFPVDPRFSVSFSADIFTSSFSTTTPSGAPRLNISAPGMTLYAPPQELTARMKMGEDNSSLSDVLSQYLESTTKLILCSESSNCFSYNLSFADFANPSTAPYKPSLSEKYPVNARYENLEIAPGTQDAHFYPGYANLIPYGCGTELSSWSYTLKNISPTDIFDTGRSWLGVELFAFVHPETSPIVQATYKIKQQDQASHWDVDTGTSTPVPDFATYVSRYPVLLFKDPWGRWVAVGENEFEPSFGCGKPVVYLYPQKPTAVRLSFARVPKFSIDIPTYHNGWHVLAHPDGTLTDLQTRHTDCSTIDVARAGSEYAADACANNAYPYLYWAGRANGAYPETNEGWIVERKQLDSFMQTELERIGLSDAESRDMRSFWVSKLLQSPAPYYRLSFFTTSQMNSFIPMKVVPKPDSVLRVFLDWNTLSAKPKDPIQPQIFSPFIRRGFTVVEWGGLER